MVLRPEDRFQTMADMRNALFQKLASPAPPTQRLSLRRRYSGLAVFLIGLVVIIGLVIALYSTDSALERSASRRLAELFGPMRTLALWSPG